MSEPAIYDTLLRELRRSNLYPPEERQLQDLRAKLEAQISADTPYSGTDAGKYAVLVHGMAVKSFEDAAEKGKQETAPHGEEDSIEFLCLDTLAAAGPFGKTMAASILTNKGLNFSKFKKWLTNPDNDHALVVADRILALGPEDVPERIEFARSITEGARDLDMDSAAGFFNSNGTSEGQLTFATLENFMTGGFGNSCRKGLFEPETLHEITTCTDYMPAYPDKSIVEDIAFHLRTKDPIIMEKVLRAIDRIADELDNSTLKEIIPLTLSPSLPLSKAAMDIVARFGNSRRGEIFAKIFNEHPKSRAEVINRLPLLSSSNFSRFMDKISEGFHAPVISALFATLADEDSLRLGSVLSAILKSSTSSKKKNLKPLLDKILEKDSFAPFEKPDPDEARNVPGQEFLTQGAPIVLNVERKDTQVGFMRIFGKEAETEEEVSQTLPDRYVDAQISNQHIHKLNRWKNQARALKFNNCKFSACDFRNTFLDKCVFKGCSFEACTLSFSTLRSCKFIKCSFKGCSSSETIFYDCDFSGTTFDSSHFDSTKIIRCAVQRCDFHAFEAAGSFISNSKIISSLFNIAGFQESYFNKTIIKGTEFKNSDFSGSLFSEGEVNSSEFQGCIELNIRAQNVRTDSDVLLNAMQRTLKDKLTLREKLKKSSTGPGKLGKYERGVIFKTVKHWFVIKDIERSHALFAAYNRRRIDWAEMKMNFRKSELVKALPALLHTNLFEREFGVAHLCMQSRISGYTLKYDDYNRLKTIFPNQAVDNSKEEYIPIKAFMSIGSTGTIAQTAASDLDCWVCCDFSGLPPESRSKLNFKLHAIEEWADKVFGLELHFFVMDIEEIRNNQFGLSDEESSGSAQSAILKEEFYRTALLLAGRPPLWWFTPPGADDRIYEGTRKKVKILKGADFATDMGNVPVIPMEEFFGASLWQVVKGIKSPFKSIMKFGLLEMYVSGSKYMLLCEMVKKNILEGKQSLQRVDPYMLLYKSLADFYKTQKKPEKTWLTAMALRLKCGLIGEKGISGTPTRPEEKELMEFALSLSGTDKGVRISNFKGLTDFRSVVVLGKRINQFMMDTYTKVRGEQDKMGGVAITPEDLTRLGRIIFANFSKRKNKIEKLSLPGPRTHFFDSITLSRDKKKKWEIHGEYPDESGARNILTKLESGLDLAKMLVWFGLNGLYDSKIKIKTDLSSAPMRSRELKKLFSDISNFFPLKKTFSTPIEETLNAEQMQKAFFIVNLCVPREHKKVKEVHLVYSTNWGEVFCLPLKVTPQLQELPEMYLKDNFPELCSGQIKMGQFIPQSAECEYLKIPVL